MVNVGTHAQGSAVQESISAGAGRQSSSELAVLARDAQALPFMPNSEHRSRCPVWRKPTTTAQVTGHRAADLAERGEAAPAAPLCQVPIGVRPADAIPAIP